MFSPCKFIKCEVGQVVPFRFAVERKRRDSLSKFKDRGLQADCRLDQSQDSGLVRFDPTVSDWGVGFVRIAGYSALCRIFAKAPRSAMSMGSVTGLRRVCDHILRTTARPGASSEDAPRLVGTRLTLTN
jgi:hypothetical protein